MCFLCFFLVDDVSFVVGNVVVDDDDGSCCCSCCCRNPIKLVFRFDSCHFFALDLVTSI